MRIFTQEIIVAPQHIDIQNRVSNLCYVQWMQVWPSTLHCQGGAWTCYEAEGHGLGRPPAYHHLQTPCPCRRCHHRRHLGWPSLPPGQSLRRYLFWRAADRSVLAEAATVWVYIDMATGRPSRLPASLQSAFEVVADDKEVCSSCRASRHKRQVCLFSVYFPRSPVHDRAGQTAARRAAKENWATICDLSRWAGRKKGRQTDLPPFVMADGCILRL